LLIYWNYNLFVLRLDPDSRIFLRAWLLFEWVVFLLLVRLTLYFFIWNFFSSLFFTLLIVALYVLYINLTFLLRYCAYNSSIRLFDFLEFSLSQSLKLKLIRTIILPWFLNYRSRIGPKLRNFRLSYITTNRIPSGTSLTEFNWFLAVIIALVIFTI
jgi:hypothetical protein